MGSSSCCLLLLHRLPFSPPVSHHHHPHHYHHHPNSFPIAAATTNKLSSLLTSCSSSSSSSASTGRQKVQGRRELLGGLIVGVAIQGSSCAFLAGCRQATAAEEQQEQEHLLPEVGLIEGRLRGCKGAAPCVSTSAFQSPSRFMPPWVVSFSLSLSLSLSSLLHFFYLYRTGNTEIRFLQQKINSVFATCWISFCNNNRSSCHLLIIIFCRSFLLQNVCIKSIHGVLLLGFMATEAFELQQSYPLQSCIQKSSWVRLMMMIHTSAIFDFRSFVLGVVFGKSG
jgi:hypothetical protein